MAVPAGAFYTELRLVTDQRTDEQDKHSTRNFHASSYCVAR